MGCDEATERARDFARTAAHLASEALLLIQHDDAAPIDGRTVRALLDATDAAEELTVLAREGVPLADAYADATLALREAAMAIATRRIRAAERAPAPTIVSTHASRLDGDSIA